MQKKVHFSFAQNRPERDVYSRGGMIKASMPREATTEILIIMGIKSKNNKPSHCCTEKREWNNEEKKERKIEYTEPEKVGNAYLIIEAYKLSGCDIYEKFKDDPIGLEAAKRENENESIEFFRWAQKMRINQPEILEEAFSLFEKNYPSAEVN